MLEIITSLLWITYYGKAVFRDIGPGVFPYRVGIGRISTSGEGFQDNQAVFFLTWNVIFDRPGMYTKSSVSSKSRWSRSERSPEGPTPRCRYKASC